VPDAFFRHSTTVKRKFAAQIFMLALRKNSHLFERWLFLFNMTAIVMSSASLISPRAESAGLY
jgi:hypothetical protein